MVLSDRIAVMREGKLQQIGPPMAVYREPRNLFVASFIGSPAMNFLDVEVAQADGALHCAFAGQTLRLPLAAVRPESLGGFRAGRKAVLGIRPPDLAVGGGRELDLAGEVFLVEPIGPVTYVDVDVGGRAVKAICDPDQAPAVGERVTLGFQAGRVRLFDPVAETRL